jgi:hypothetical protein
MNQQTKSETLPKKGIMVNTFFLLNISFLFIFPLLSVAFEHYLDHSAVSGDLLGKWFIFWAVGIRLFTAGIKQASNPEFTATQIFKFNSRESYIVIRELGFANMALGTMGILSVINEQWRLIAAITSGLFFGLAGVQHLLKKPVSQNEWIAEIYDLLVFAGLVIYVMLR